jgi:hypothetical protein
LHDGLQDRYHGEGNYTRKGNNNQPVIDERTGKPMNIVDIQNGKTRKKGNNDGGGQYNDMDPKQKK